MIGKLGVIMVILAGTFCACTKDRKPDDVLDKEQMTSLLIDVYVAEARLSSTIFIADSARHVFEPYERSLLQRRGLPDSVLKKSYAYYLDHPTEMEEIMAAVVDSLSLREQAASKVTQPQ